MMTAYHATHTPASREGVRTEIEKQVQEFLDAGGKIENIPSPQSTSQAVASAWQYAAGNLLG